MSSTYAFQVEVLDVPAEVAEAVIDAAEGAIVADFEVVEMPDTGIGTVFIAFVDEASSSCTQDDLEASVASEILEAIQEALGTGFEVSVYAQWIGE